MNSTPTHFPLVKALRPGAARAKRRCAFTLMEIIIVVVVVGLLATVVLPQFTNDNKQARQLTLKDDLQYLRTQIAVYRAQHQDVSPGYSHGYALVNPNAYWFVQQMTRHSDINCNLSDTNNGAYPYGPYIKQLPANPCNNSNAVIVVPNNYPMPKPGGPAGWIYKAQTQEIIANLAGNDDSGIPYSTY